MGNVIRIVAGVAGLSAAGWSAVRVLRARRCGQERSFAATYVVLAATAGVISLTLLL